MAVDDEDVRLAVYRSLAATSACPDAEGLATSLGSKAADIRNSLQRLANARHLVLGDDHRVVMAHPFATIPLGFSVMGVSTLWWGGCAWDAFAMPHLVDNEPGHQSLPGTRS